LVWQNIGCFDEHEVVQGSCISYDRLPLQAESPVRVAIPLNVFQCVFQFDAMALQKGIDMVVSSEPLSEIKRRQIEMPAVDVYRANL
jgi:hypothetical protein